MSKNTEERLEIELSNRKETRLSFQLSRVIDDSEINQIGVSRYEQKQNALEKGASGSHEINQKIGITSYASMEKFESQIKVFSLWCFATENLNNLNQIKPEMVAGFLNELCDRDYARNTVQSYASALEKFAVVLDRTETTAIPRTESWHAAIEGVRGEINGCEQKDTGARAYEDPQAIINNLPSERLQLVGDMQLNYGLRIADATKINGANLSENNVLTVENSKNGQDLHIPINDADAQRIREICGKESLGVKQSEYRDALKTACEITGQEWNGSHGLRHNFAQNRMCELVEGGVPYTKALATVSSELGHHREEITHTYLRG